MSKIIAGNWKMYNTPSVTGDVIKELVPLIENKEDTVIIAPTAISIPAAISTVGSSKAIKIAAQNVYCVDEGAFTGEISIPMVKEVGCEYIIIGHSERRHIFGESDELLNNKVKAVLAAGIIPIFCIGEQLEDRESGKTIDVLKGQLEDGLAGIDKADLAKIVVAYEPVWAIGTGKTATSLDAENTIAEVRKVMDTLGQVSTIPILYGGSVKPDNAKEILSMENIDGVLVGGASLKAQSFAEIINYNK